MTPNVLRYAREMARRPGWYRAVRSLNGWHPALVIPSAVAHKLVDLGWVDRDSQHGVSPCVRPIHYYRLNPAGIDALENNPET